MGLGVSSIKVSLLNRMFTVKNARIKIRFFIKKEESKEVDKKEHIKEIENRLLLTQKTALLEGYNKGLFSKKTRDYHLSTINEELLKLRPEH